MSGGGGESITRGGTIYPRVYCPGDTFSRGTLYPPTPVATVRAVGT